MFRQTKIKRTEVLYQILCIFLLSGHLVFFSLIMPEGTAQSSTRFKELEGVNRKPRHSHSQESVDRTNQGFESFMITWMYFIKSLFGSFDSSGNGHYAHIHISLLCLRKRIFIIFSLFDTNTHTHIHTHTHTHTTFYLTAPFCRMKENDLSARSQDTTTGR